MAGTVRGRIDCLVTEASNSILCAQAKFKTIFDFLSSLPGWTRIAWYMGNAGGNIPGGAKRGNDYHDGEAPFGHLAFAVFKVRGTVKTWYCLIQFLDGQSTDPTGAGAPARFAGGGIGYAGVGIQMAWGYDAEGNELNPWNGSTKNDGTDTKGTDGGEVWKVAEGELLRVLPRSNGMGGKFSPLREDLANLGTPHHKFAAYLPHRFHLVADDDSLVLLEDYGDSGSVSMTYAGIYVPRAGWNPIYPFLLVHNESNNGLWSVSQSIDSRYGDLYGGTPGMNGGIAIPEGSTLPGVRSLCFDRMEGFAATSSFQPNGVVSDFEEWAICCGVNEQESALHGWLGFLDPSLLREAFGMNNNAYKKDKSRVYMGSGLAKRLKYSIPWDGQQVPGTNRTREGISF